MDDIRSVAEQSPEHPYRQTQGEQQGGRLVVRQTEAQHIDYLSIASFVNFVARTCVSCLLTAARQYEEAKPLAQALPAFVTIDIHVASSDGLRWPQKENASGQELILGPLQAFLQVKLCQELTLAPQYSFGGAMQGVTTVTSFPSSLRPFIRFWNRILMPLT